MHSTILEPIRRRRKKPVRVSNCLVLSCMVACSTAQAARLSIPVPFPEPAALAEVGVSVVARVGETVETLVETPTVTDPLTPGFTSVSGEIDTQVLERSRGVTGEGAAQALGSTLVSIPDRSHPSPADPEPVVSSQSPQVQASASASISVLNTSRKTASVQAQSSLAYYFEIAFRDETTATSILETTGTVPVSFRVRADLSASVDPTSSFSTRAGATGTITVSTDPITVDAFGNLVIPIPDDDTLTEDIFRETVFAGRSDQIEDSLEPALRSFTVEADLLPSVPGWLGKTVDASVFVVTEKPDDTSGAGEAHAVLDPVIIFDEARFQARYGARCAMLFGGEPCPTMESLFALKMSAFVGNGLPPENIVRRLPIWLLYEASKRTHREAPD